MTACWFISPASAQRSDSSHWNFGAEANVYLIQNESFIIPVIRADNNKLHLEARYNYEDFRTVSVWAGYNITGGKKIEYTIIPMIGGVVGLSNGIATGMEFTLTAGRFELYSESEYLFETNHKENSYMYTWTDMTYSLSDHWFAGLSIQRTRLYQTALDLQRGFLLGGSIKNLEVTGYLYNTGFDTAFGILTIGINF